MADTDRLVIGLPLELKVLEGEYEGSYRSRIEEVSDKVMVIGAPYEKGEIVPLREGTQIELMFWDGFSAYVFETEIMRRIAVPFPMFALPFPESVVKIQRRNFVRISVSYPIKFRIVMEEGFSDIVEGVMLDVSGGGIRFSTRSFLESGALLDAQLFLPNKVLDIPIRTIRAEKEDLNSRNYVVTGEFLNINERMRDNLVRCIFDIQRELRKKGLM